MEKTKAVTQEKIEAKEKKCCQEMDVAESLLKEGNERLAKALETKDLSEASIAGSLVDSANKKFLTVKPKREELCSERDALEKKKEKIVKKLKKTLQ